MIAKNSVILITQINDERAAGMGVREAAVSAAMNRLRPLILTALSTVLGLLPIAPTLFWGPMAFAIMGGLLVATVLTLIVLPVLYVTLYGDRPGRPRRRSRGDGTGRRMTARGRVAAGGGGCAPPLDGDADKASYYRLFVAYILALLATGVATVGLALFAYRPRGRGFGRRPRHGAVAQDAGLHRRRPGRRRAGPACAPQAAPHRARPPAGGEPPRPALRHGDLAGPRARLRLLARLGGLHARLSDGGALSPRQPAGLHEVARALADRERARILDQPAPRRGSPPGREPTSVFVVAAVAFLLSAWLIARMRMPGSRPARRTARLAAPARARASSSRSRTCAGSSRSTSRWRRRAPWSWSTPW
jgi:hypothetical protein